MKRFERREIQRRRETLGFSARGLSAKSGLGSGTVGAIESGDIVSPTVGVLEKICAQLGCEIGDLYVDHAPEPPQLNESAGE